MKPALVVILAALLLAGAAGAATARLRLIATSPVVVGGSGFHPREHVRVRVALGKSRGAVAKTVIASAAGAIVLRFRASADGPCGSITITAVGDAGSRAVWKSPRPVCGTDPAPPGP